MTSLPFVLSTTNVSENRNIRCLFYGHGKVGKTSLVLSLPSSNDERIAYLNVDPGELVLRHRSFTKLSAPDGLWTREVLEGIYKFLASDGRGKFDYIVVDGLDDLGQKILQEVMKTTKDGRKAYGEMAEFVHDWAHRIRDLKGISPIFITHIDQLQDNTGGLYFAPSFPGKQIGSQLINWFDLVGCMRIIQIGEGKSERFIQFSAEADPRYQVGDRSGVLDQFERPDMKAIFAKILDAGFQVVDNSPTRITKVQLDELAEFCKTKGIERSAVKQKATELFGPIDISSLNTDQYQKLKDSL